MRHLVYILTAICLIVGLVIASSKTAYKPTSAESKTIMQTGFPPWVLNQHAAVCNDLDTLFSLTGGGYADSLYKAAIKAARLRGDSVIGTGSLFTRLRGDSAIFTASLITRVRTDSIDAGASRFSRLRGDSIIGTGTQITRLRGDSAIFTAAKSTRYRGNYLFPDSALCIGVEPSWTVYNIIPIDINRQKSVIRMVSTASDAPAAIQMYNNLSTSFTIHLQGSTVAGTYDGGTAKANSLSFDCNPFMAFQVNDTAAFFFKEKRTMDVCSLAVNVRGFLKSDSVHTTAIKSTRSRPSHLICDSITVSSGGNISALTVQDAAADTLVITIGAKTWKFLPVANQ